MEGSLYHRFAIRPLLIFAEALQLHRPELDIYNYNDQTIRRTIKALLATTYQTAACRRSTMPRAAWASVTRAC